MSNTEIEYNKYEEDDGEYTVIKNTHGRVGLKLKWGVSKSAKAFLKNNDIDYLILDAGELTDLGFLVEHKEKITDIHIKNPDIDWSVINQLRNIRAMDIGGWFDCRGLDYSSFNNLVYLKTYWNKGYEESLRDINSLKLLDIVGTKSDSLECLGTLPSLEYLICSHSKKLSSLKGIENFNQLRYVHIEACAVLESIDDISKCSAIEHVFFANCKRLMEYQAISSLSELKQLILVGETDSLSWLAKLDNLIHLRFDCKLSDGNIDFLYDLESLQYAKFKNKKGYSVKLKDFQAYLEQHGYAQNNLDVSRDVLPRPSSRELLQLK